MEVSQNEGYLSGFGFRVWGLGVLITGVLVFWGHVWGPPI